MPDLLQSLQKYDLGHLLIVAGFWGLELKAKDTDSAASELAPVLLNPDLLNETIEILPSEARSALETLTEKNGRISWAEFARQFGEIREMGPGKRDREHPHATSATPTEALFYRALLARAFFNTPGGALEFAYIPEDLLSTMLAQKGGRFRSTDSKPLGRPASPGEKAHPLAAGNALLDDATTLLAALRIGISPPKTSLPTHVLESFLRAAKIIQRAGPKPEDVKTFLEAPRARALKMLSDAWLESEIFNELRQLPGLTCEGEWKNQPLETRKFLLRLLEIIPQGMWWSLGAFVRDMKTNFPDFQRPAGDYDSWFIKREADGAYLRGFAYWEQVDGALIRYLIAGPLFWLGKVDLATSEEAGEPTSFRVNTADADKKEVRGKIVVSSNGRISVERTAPRPVRYQIARFCEWEDIKADTYHYRITPVSLKRAAQQGLNIEHLLPLLSKHASGGVPPTQVKALKRWEANGTEARVQSLVVLRVSNPQILEEFRKSKAARFLGESLGPTTVVVKNGAQAKALAALAELGLLAEEEK